MASLLAMGAINTKMQLFMKSEMAFEFAVPDAHKGGLGMQGGRF